MDQEAPSTLETFVEETRAELENSQRELKEIKLTINQSRSELEKLTQRNAQVAAQLRQMQAEGWNVDWGLTWIAKAKRGDVYEEVTGATKEEALDRLRQMTRLHVVDGCP